MEIGHDLNGTEPRIRAAWPQCPTDIMPRLLAPIPATLAPAAIRAEVLAQMLLVAPRRHIAPRSW